MEDATHDLPPDTAFSFEIVLILPLPSPPSRLFSHKPNKNPSLRKIMRNVLKIFDTMPKISFSRLWVI